MPRHAMRLLPIANARPGSADVHGLAAVVAQTIQATLDLYARRGYQPPWIGHLALEDGLSVGGCGFAGPPAAAEVEIAYFTFPGHEGRGVATRMAHTLLRQTRRAAADAGIRFIAHTLPQEGASTRILRKLGFMLYGEVMHPEDGVVWKWVDRD
jgi:RimJ/RimL family protein N-acetyltransferase